MRDDPESFYDTSDGELGREIISDLQTVSGKVTDRDLRDYRPITRESYQRALGHENVPDPTPDKWHRVRAHLEHFER